MDFVRFLVVLVGFEFGFFYDLSVEVRMVVDLYCVGFVAVGMVVHAAGCGVLHGALFSNYSVCSLQYVPRTFSAVRPGVADSAL